MHKILIVQTAYIGDVILATGLIESIHQAFPEAQIDFVLRKGNESLLKNHPFVNKLYIWDKKKNKFSNLIKLIGQIRKERFDLVVNLQRFFSTGLIALCAKSKNKRGYDKNPLSFCYHKKTEHFIGKNHETYRNFSLIDDLKNIHYQKPHLYFTAEEIQKVQPLKSQPFVCMAPGSVWFTKQLPIAKWAELILTISDNIKIYLIGAPVDAALCNEIRLLSSHPKIEILCGKLTLTESAALMQHAEMNYVNDSAPLHLASAVNAPVTAFFCSTVPEFGFGPLSDKSVIKQVGEMSCRPCGLHGYKSCPLGHFDCAYKIEI
ncbi:MAG: glycosyltransferase family 9 protein [Bacteroidetes bacterium]|jgi:heptosyltransferase-2|nr:glycosyltransferase family 9 protein [Bacteroidota bacterium]MBX7237989.1 glycosyltransferase family 9 protein [Bacteroidia bacterium]MCC7514040.1 glycosyltransferase family 9 protein [Bacteroidia bacterium]HMX95777.1 glycosyltransferase family 9 protein [Bacteroidia bacterium]HMY13190.1 glycosyltransferase family 9 protein [Bacteroidia bacterium]